MPRWRSSCGPGAPLADELELELTNTTSKACLSGRVITIGARAAGWTEGLEHVCLQASSSDRWDGLERGMLVYVVPVARDEETLEAQMTCAYRPAHNDE
jgi:hypothetical protein